MRTMFEGRARRCGITLVLMICSSLQISALAADKAVGTATVYSDSFNGKKTATGKTFNNGGVSAASNKLPLGSKVKIRNPETGKQITATVNDRTAKNAKCAVDLSKGAAQKLGVKGKAPVEATVVGSGDKGKNDAGSADSSAKGKTSSGTHKRIAHHASTMSNQHRSVASRERSAQSHARNVHQVRQAPSFKRKGE